MFRNKVRTYSSKTDTICQRGASQTLASKGAAFPESNLRHLSLRYFIAVLANVLDANGVPMLEDDGITPLYEEIKVQYQRDSKGDLITSDCGKHLTGVPKPKNGRGACVAHSAGIRCRQQLKVN